MKKLGSEVHVNERCTKIKCVMNNLEVKVSTVFKTPLIVTKFSMRTDEGLKGEKN